jgi:hypothetical protein
VVWSATYEPGYVYCQHDRFFDREPNLVVVPGSRQPALAGQTQPWSPPARTPATPGVGRAAGRTFQGPDPKVVGISDDRVSNARYVPPKTEQPSGVQWKPAPTSRVPDPSRRTLPGTIPGQNRPVEGRTNGNPGVTPGPKPTYTPSDKRRIEEPPIRPPTAPVSGPRYSPSPTYKPSTPSPVYRPSTPVSRPSTPVTKPVSKPIVKPKR